MDPIIPDLDKRTKEAIKQFWLGRKGQAEKQKIAGKVQDAGTRSSVTGGNHMDGFVNLVADSLLHVGLPKDCIVTKRRGVVIPGYYRPTKQWDLLAIYNHNLLAAVEFKSQVGSIGNNLNNRTEEALGNSTDILKAYEKGLFLKSPQPWLGWMMVLGDSEVVNRPISARADNFPVDPVFKSTSYSGRYQILAKRMLHERHYSGACVILTPNGDGVSGAYKEPDNELTMRRFIGGLAGHVSGYLATLKK